MTWQPISNWRARYKDDKTLVIGYRKTDYRGRLGSIVPYKCHKCENGAQVIIRKNGIVKKQLCFICDRKAKGKKL